jgi:hypothetical protein
MVDPEAGERADRAVEERDKEEEEDRREEEEEEEEGDEEDLRELTGPDADASGAVFEASISAEEEDTIDDLDLEENAEGSVELCALPPALVLPRRLLGAVWLASGW